VDPAWKLDGVDLLPHLNGQRKEPPHDVLYWRFGEQWAIRKGDWKLCVNRIDGVKKTPALYNLKDDIGESTDLSEKEPAKAKELKSLWDTWSDAQAKPAWGPG
jgi:arylsulfatase A-like enzyme